MCPCLEMVPMPTPRLIAAPADLTFHGSQSIALPRPLTALEAWNLVMAQPLPGLNWAFRLRDALCAPFGVKRITGFSGARAEAVAVGQPLDFFLVEEADSDLLVLTARDRHLSVMTCVATEPDRLTITASVITHNAFGKAYMLPVAPAHRYIVRRMLARVARTLR